MQFVDLCNSSGNLDSHPDSRVMASQNDIDNTHPIDHDSHNTRSLPAEVVCNDGFTRMHRHRNARRLVSGSRSEIQDPVQWLWIEENDREH